MGQIFLTEEFQLIHVEELRKYKMTIRKNTTVICVACKMQ